MPSFEMFACISFKLLWHATPRCRLLIDGFRMLAAGSPNMNSLISLGATTSFLGGVYPPSAL
jgi:cation transport ATPase